MERRRGSERGKQIETETETDTNVYRDRDRVRDIDRDENVISLRRHEQRKGHSH